MIVKSVHKNRLSGWLLLLDEENLPIISLSAIFTGLATIKTKISASISVGNLDIIGRGWRTWNKNLKYFSLNK